MLTGKVLHLMYRSEKDDSLAERQDDHHQMNLGLSNPLQLLSILNNFVRFRLLIHLAFIPSSMKNF